MLFTIARPALLLLISGACVSTSTFATNPPGMRQPIDTPARFVTDDGTGAAGDGCRNPLVDPRDQIRLRLVRSGSVDSTLQGDYEAPEGRYGVTAGELLRVDCRTGQPVGIVAK